MGSKSAWAQIVEQHGETILRVAYRILRNLHDAEDVAQEVLVEAYSKEKVPAIALLKRMTAFRSIDRLRRRTGAVRLDELSHSPHERPKECQVEIDEQANVLRNAIGRLPEKQAQCFWLRYVDGLSNLEISKALSMSESAVSTSLFRARSNLRKKLCKEGNSIHE